MRTVSPTRTRAPLAIIGVVALVVVACGGGTSSPSAGATQSTAQPSVTASTAPPASSSGLGSAPPSSPLPSPGGSAATPDRPDLAAVKVDTSVVAGGLSSPLWVGPVPDGSGRIVVAEQGGTLRMVKDGQLQASPYLDISDRISAGGERGLLGVAFPPGFGTTNQRLFVHYSDKNGDTTVVFYDAPVGATSIDAGTEQLILHEAQPYANHNGGWIGFDPTGMLLIALGDGGSGGDPENRASNLNELLGKMLRVDVLGAAAGQPYAIPADNPFVGRSDARPEILHYGLRNPFRDSIDPATGNLWIGDVGQNAWEEIDVAPAAARGLDFGWHRWEGRHCYDPPTGCDPTGVTMPVTEYPHELGCAVIGGVVYHGAAIPALRGAYLFSDNCTGTLWAIDAGLDASEQAPITLLETHRAISAIGVDDAGEVYLTDLSGGDLLKLVAAS
ncbi:MAG TPA: PQQ-dependent sugar dehydrogenase [Candidatus Limnocylindrales bacterium]|jgi:glucose/arabinose dehydrogenase